MYDLAARSFLVARGLCKAYTNSRWSRQPGRQVLHDVNLMVRAGETLALVGKSASGKTTLAMCMAGIAPVDCGEIMLDGCNLLTASKAKKAQLRRQIQIIFQDSAGALSPLLSAADIVEEPMRVQNSVHRSERRERVLALCAQVGLSSNLMERRPHQLSGGQRQRLAIARALASEARFLILDEPFAGLDLSARGEIINLLLEVQAVHCLGYLYISHELETLRYFADKIAILDRGRIVELQPTSELFSRPMQPVTREILDASQLSPSISRQKDGAACASC